MESNSIELGVRKLQYSNGALLVNVPNVAVRILSLRPGDMMGWSLSDGILQLQRIEEAV